VPAASRRTAIVGLGLMGGSMALGLRDTREVRGYDVDLSTREAARGRGIATADSLAALFPADVVIVATPLEAVVPTLDDLAPLAGSAVVVEVGSLKRDVAAYAGRAPSGARIVGLHPMAGTTESGFGTADPAIFRDRPFLVVATARSDDDALAETEAIARELGGRPVRCSAEEHDRAVAMLSGVPLVAALALARAGEDVAHLAGPGFAGATRLAATPPDLARAILRGDRDNVKAALARFRRALDEVERSF